MEEEKINCWVGIDPGKNGGLLAMNANGQMKSWKMPLNGSDVSAKEIFTIFSTLKRRYNITVIIEEVHSIFGTSASSNFTFGFVCGLIEAIVIAQNLRFVKVVPKTWQKEIWIFSDMEYQPLKEGKKTRQINTKATSLKAARRLFPTFDFRASSRSTNPHDGIIDAALICEYGRRKNF